jgi:nucleoside-diphosphate-sugar epimerase
MMKNVLIIGGSYFIGRVFVEELLKEDQYAIYVMNRGNVPIRKEGVKEIASDRHNIIQMQENLPSLDWHAIVDFCAFTPSDIEAMFAVLPKDKVGHYIYISTATIYSKTFNFPIKEDEPKLTGPQPELGPFGDYAYHKWLAELELEKQCTEKSIPFTSIRPAFVYGKYNYAPRESYFIELLVQGKTIVLPDNDLALFNFVSVWDLAKILIGCVGNPAVFNQAFNAAADELLSYRRLVEVLETISGRKAKIENLRIRQIIEQQVPLPFPLDEHLIYSGKAIEKLLGFEYTPFEVAMEETYRHHVKFLERKGII